MAILFMEEHMRVNMDVHMAILIDVHIYVISI